ncbi:MAG: hypothetical protein BAJATHORv1_10611 [Candidatus Thorarchaeota archaeon]|nr:MAG: hypothetical protein BAJATHORv1_10611 [Candidatus Thorarchaeota archaeon]
MERFRDTKFGLLKIGKYLTDSELRQAYSEYKESEEIALRLIINTILSEGWMVSLSRPLTVEELAKEYGYTNMPLLNQILRLMIEEEVLEKMENTYQIKQVKTSPIRPEDIGTVLTNFYYDCAQFLPDALRGQNVKLEQVPRIVLESVFSSTLTEKGRAVLLRSFAPKNPTEVGVAAFADVGLPYTLKQIDEILSPKRIHLFMQNYRWLSPLTSVLKLFSKDNILEKLTTDLLGRSVDAHLDLLYGEELFAFDHDTLDERVSIVSSYLRPGAKVITNDPILPQGETLSSPAYILMQTIEGYPQPLSRNHIEEVFTKHNLRIQTIGDNWIIAEKVVK